MFCTNCGQELPEGSQLCDKCGANQTGIESSVEPTNRVEESASQAETQQVLNTPQIPAQSNDEGKSWKQITSLILGIVSLTLWLLPVIGLIVAIIGLVVSIMGVRTPRKLMPILGLVFCLIALLLSLVMTIIFSVGFYQGFTGGISGETSIDTSITSSKKEVSDAKNKSTIYEMQNALEQYFVDNNAYPTSLAILKYTSPPLLGSEVDITSLTYTPANSNTTYTLSFKLENQKDDGTNVSGLSPNKIYKLTNKQ